MKRCPFCAEEIQDEAIKCKHCVEWLPKKKEQLGNYENQLIPLPLHGISIDEILMGIEKNYFKDAITLAKGSRMKAANLLGISLDSFKYRLKKYDF